MVLERTERRVRGKQHLFELFAFLFLSVKSSRKTLHTLAQLCSLALTTILNVIELIRRFFREISRYIFFHSSLRRAEEALEWCGIRISNCTLCFRYCSDWVLH